ncbi:hypothetical protein [Nocardioides panacisoli]|uniref:Uncharacterized protein n=1 Tax=Nocardioides panacisoli TaxID=627624 RepID=A0ABP7IW83_9ACTN
MIALVPGVLALLPEYASIEDPVPDLRAACLDAVAALGPRVRVLGTGSGERVGRHLVETAGAEVVDAGESGVLVVANGSAKRTEKAPGHLDERAEAFDETLRELLVGPDPAGLAAIDAELGAELWADVGGLVALGDLLAPGQAVDVTYDAAPFGVQYWVIRWSPDAVPSDA